MLATKQNEIQWLRAIAAIEVVVTHSDLIAKHVSGNLLSATSWHPPIAGIGVELFFIVSGYVICMRASTYAGGWAFLLSRIARLFPMYWIFTSLVVLAVIANPAWRLAGFEFTLEKFVQSYLIFPQSSYPLLTVGWTLEHEMIFYALVAMLIAVSGGLQLQVKLSFTFILAGLALIGSAFGTGPSARFWDFHITSPYMFLFAFGWLMRCLDESDGRKNAWAIGAFIAIAVIALVLADPRDGILIWRLFVVAIVFLLFSASRSFFAVDNVLNRWASRIGDASYSLYLLHWFVLSILGKIFGVLNLPPASEWPMRLLGVALCIVLSVVVFQYVEQPIDRWLRRLLPIGRAAKPRPPSSPIPLPLEIRVSRNYFRASHSGEAPMISRGGSENMPEQQRPAKWRART